MMGRNDEYNEDMSTKVKYWKEKEVHLWLATKINLKKAEDMFSDAVNDNKA